MLETILLFIQTHVGNLNAWITSALHGNSIVAGAVTASIIGSLFFISKKLPGKFFNFIKSRLFFTYVIEYNEPNTSYITDSVAAILEYELQKRVGKRRRSALLTAMNGRLVESLASGNFYHKFDGTYIRISRIKEKASTPKGDMGQPGSVPHKLNFTVMWYNRQKVLTFISQYAREFSTNGVYRLAGDGRGGDATRIRNFTNIPVLAIDKDVKKKIDDAIDLFMNNREQNNLKDKSHKLVFMLYGEPGTGKSILSEYIAFKINSSLFCYSNNPKMAYTSGLSDIIKSVKSNIPIGDIPVVLIDDFDTVWSGINIRNKDKAPAVSHPMYSMEDKTLGALLADLQSPVEIRDCVVILTTNHLEVIDPPSG